MSEFKSQYDRQKHCAENAHYYELSHFFAITDNSSHPHGQELFFIEKRTIKNQAKCGYIMTYDLYTVILHKNTHIHLLRFLTYNAL